MFRLDGEIAGHRKVAVVDRIWFEVARAWVDHRARSPDWNAAPLCFCWEELPIPDDVAGDAVSDVVRCKTEAIDPNQGLARRKLEISLAG